MGKADTPNSSPSEALDALDEAPCAIARTSADGTFLRLNAAFVAWLGYAREELVGKRKVQDLMTMGGRIFHQTHWLPLLQMEGSVSEVRFELLHKDRRSVPMILNAIRRERGGVVVHDLAAFMAGERDKFERELIISRNKLKVDIAESTALHEVSKDRALFAEQMVGIVSHDLRTPLTVVAMSAKLLIRDNPSPSQMQILERMVRSTSRANRMIAELLDFTQARIGEGLACMPKEIDAHALIADTVDELASAYPGRQLRHLKEGDSQSFIDADRLAQLVVNLVSNAMVYGDHLQEVTVSTTSTLDCFEVSVHNHGTPIQPDALERIFQPLVRGDVQEMTTRSVGLGLYIVSEIVKAHGGRVHVVSEAKAGTTFFASFPALSRAVGA